MDKKTQTQRLTTDLKLQIRNEFVQGNQDQEGNRTFPKVEDLVKKFSVAQSTLYRVSQKENWKIERERFQETLRAKLDKQRVKDLTEESKKIDKESIYLAKSIMKTVSKSLRTNDEVMEDGKKGMIPSQLNALANAALNAQKIAKLALGETTENLNINANIQEADAFREAMELLDTVAEQRREADDSSVH